MSIKDLFNKTKTDKVSEAASASDLGKELESAELFERTIQSKERVIPHIDFSDPKNFARYGSAEQYYEDSINYIISSYPYDGSKKEKEEWYLSCSYLDKYIFDNEYPKATGYINLGLNYGSIISSSYNYTKFGDINHIYFLGSQNTGTLNVDEVDIQEMFSTSNVYDPEVYSDSNLKIDGDKGLTLEFWFKKNSFISGSESGKQVIFDIWNSGSVASSNYGRFRLEIHPGISGEENKFFIELLSGSNGLSKGTAPNVIGIGNNLNLISSSWNQYSISVINSGSNMVAKLYKNGYLNDSVLTGSSINAVSGSMIGTIGALTSAPTGTIANYGWAKLSASLDEVRFWKKRRSSTDIGKYWFTNVGGGANSDYSNSSLGLYYKFNEGIVSSTSTNNYDSIILDYSGRINNGTWYGYTVGSRNTGSAIELAKAAQKEEKDPIIYSFHSEITSLKNLKQQIAILHDNDNNASIYNTFPAWIIDDDQEKGRNELKKLTQIISSFFDNMHIQISMLPKIKEMNYVSGSDKPLPFVSRMLENMNLHTPDVFKDAGVMETLLSRDNYREFSEKLPDIRNKIYQNIYNNLIYIYKSKGTEKSYRNLIRNFGIDEELIKINLYADNMTYELNDNFKYTAVKKNYIDFNDSYRYGASVYQNTSSANSSRSYVAAPSNLSHHGSTYQIEAIFPKKFGYDTEFFSSAPFTIVSLFGAHTADCHESSDKTWASPDLGNFQVFAIKTAVDSNDIYFKLSGSNGCVLPILTSSIFYNAYDNQKWNLNVRIKPVSYPYADGVSGSSNSDFAIEFSGYNTELDLIKNSFSVTSSISNPSGISFMTSAKRFYVGAHRQNFTGSVLHFSDVKLSSFRVWMKYLNDEELQFHSKDPSNYGSLHPYRKSYITELSRSFGI